MTFRDADQHVDGAVKAFDPQSMSSSDIDGDSIDRQSFGNPQSAVLKISLNSSNGSDAITFTVQESSDDSSWSDVVDSKELGQNTPEDKVFINLNGYDRYIRVQYDDSDSNNTVAGSPTAAAEWILFGAKEAQRVT